MSKFLIVEKNAVVFQSLRELYSEHLPNIEVIAVADPEEAHVLIHKEPRQFIGILAQLGMDRTDGIKFLSRIRNDFPFIRHLAVTTTLVGHTDPPGRLGEEAQAIGAVLISKTSPKQHIEFAKRTLS